MSKGKSYNRIVFLTTLSLYLGLVLVSATPQVLAQTASTIHEYEINFAKKNKEEKDKPLDDKNLFIPQIIHLVTELDSLNKEQIFDWNAKNHFQIEGLSFCQSDNSPTFEGSSSLDNRKINEVFDNFAIRLGREISKRRAVSKFGDFYSQNISFDFLTEDSNFSIKTTVDNKNPQEFLAFLDELTAYFNKFSSFRNSSKERVVYENTKVTTENDQVFIVTRLPRGSIDSLLAKND